MDANTPATQAIPDDDPIEDSPTPDSPTPDSPTPDSPTPDSGSTPHRPKGPNAAAIVVGLVAMVLAGLIIAKETMGLRVDWSLMGPGAIVGIGVLLVVLGAIGLVRRRDDV
jgi:hypothetical protein